MIELRYLIGIGLILFLPIYYKLLFQFLIHSYRTKRMAFNQHLFANIIAGMMMPILAFACIWLGEEMDRYLLHAVAMILVNFAFTKWVFARELKRLEEREREPQASSEEIVGDVETEESEHNSDDIDEYEKELEAFWEGDEI